MPSIYPIHVDVAQSNAAADAVNSNIPTMNTNMRYAFFILNPPELFNDCDMFFL
jgi:hypothetical protein